MDTRAILAKIMEDAQSAASDILAQAQEKADRVRITSEARILADNKAEAARMEADARDMELRMLRMAELEDRKKLLAAKRDLLAKLFARVMEKLKAMPAAEARAFFMDLLVASAGGGEKILIGDTNDGWFDGLFLEEANAALLSKTGKSPLDYGGKARGMGFLLLNAQSEINCTIESILKEKWTRMEADIAGMLFV